MRNVIICVVCALVAFGLMTVVLSASHLVSGGGPTVGSDDGRNAGEPVLMFPEDLAPLTQGKAVPAAAPWKKEPTAPMVVLARWSGKLHSFNEYLDAEWKSAAVEETQLVLLLSKHTKYVLEIVPYQQGPPVRRCRFDTDVWLVEARTGQTLASRRFVKSPPPAPPVTYFELTEVGEHVEWSEIREWMLDEIERLRAAPVAEAGAGLLQRLQEQRPANTTQHATARHPKR